MLVEFQENLEFDAVLFKTILMAFFSFGIVFVACEFGQRVSNAFGEINSVVGQFDWYLFSDDLQKILPIIINFAQQPVNIEFFGNISCNRLVFESVC